jgi:hypothetical protein
MPTTKERISSRIQRMGPGHAFTPKDFLDLGSRGMVDVTLSQLASSGVIRRLGRGLYDLPKYSEALGITLGPDVDQIAQAIARRFRWRIMPTGAWAANALGLSTQVPAKIVFLSDGPNRKLEFGKQILQFKHARPKEMRTDGALSGLVIQALRYLGKEQVGPQVIDHLRGRLSPTEKRRLVRDSQYSTDWILAVARQVAEEDT